MSKTGYSQRNGTMSVQVCRFSIKGRSSTILRWLILTFPSPMAKVLGMLAICRSVDSMQITSRHFMVRGLHCILAVPEKYLCIRFRRAALSYLTRQCARREAFVHCITGELPGRQRSSKTSSTARSKPETVLGGTRANGGTHHLKSSCINLSSMEAISIISARESPAFAIDMAPRTFATRR